MSQNSVPDAYDLRAIRHELLRYLVDEREFFLCDAMRLLGSRDQAEDIIQNAAIRCLETGAISGEIKNPRSLVRRMVHNLALDQLRRRTRDNTTPLDPSNEPGCDCGNPERQLSVRQALEQVDMALNQLPPKHRYIFLKHRLGEFRQKDIAQEVGLSPARINGIVNKSHISLNAARESLMEMN